MTLPQAPQNLNAFIDGELPLSERLAYEDRLRHDPALAAQVDDAQALSQALRAQAACHRAPPGLLERFQAEARAGQRLQPRPEPRRQRLQDLIERWFAWRPMASACALTSALFLGLHLLLQTAPTPDERLGEEVVASHVRATLAQRLVDMPSSDRHTVKPWLSSRLDYSPPVPDLRDQGTPLQGGRIDYLAGRPVAALVYQHGQHVVEDYVWPDPQADHPLQSGSQRGFQWVRWTRQGMTHWLVSDLQPDELMAVAQALAQTGTPH